MRPFTFTHIIKEWKNYSNVPFYSFYESILHNAVSVLADVRDNVKNRKNPIRLQNHMLEINVNFKMLVNNIYSNKNNTKRNDSLHFLSK